MSRYRSHSRSPEPASADFHFTRGEGSGSGGGADSASGGSGGSGLECLQLRSPPGPFHYLISEQAKSFVALQELQNEVGALLEFRDLVMETFPTLRHKLPAGPAGSRDAASDWEPGVRVRRKLASGAGAGAARSKPQPSVQDSGFSTETSCKSSGGGGAGSGAGASGTPALEDELWALLDVIQRKGSRLRDDAELLRIELERAPMADEWFGRAIAAVEPCTECMLRRDLEVLPPKATFVPKTPLGRLDQVLATPPRLPRVRTPDSTKFAAILQETSPIELQRHLLLYTVHAQALEERAARVTAQRGELLDKLRRATDLNDDLRFQLEEKSIELEGARAQLRLSGGGGAARGSMRDLTPLALPPAESSPPAPPITDTPRRTRRSRIPLPGHKARAPSAPQAAPPTPAPASYRSRSGEGRKSSCVPVRRPSSTAATDEAKVRPKSFWNILFNFKEANSS